MNLTELQKRCVSAIEARPDLRASILDLHQQAEERSEEGDETLECGLLSDALDRLLVAAAVIPTFCPVFPGFYSTVFDMGERFEANELSCVLEEAGVPVRADRLIDIAADETIDWDYTAYHREYAASVVRVVSAALAPLGVSLRFECVASPREYNYLNDVLNVEAVIPSPEDFKQVLLGWLLDNEEEFAEYLKEHFESYDGFISFHSSKTDEWLEELRNWDPAAGYDPARFGSLLDCYLLIEEGFDQYELYHTAYEPNLPEYLPGYVDLAIKELKRDYAKACVTMERYAAEKAHRADSVERQRVAHEETLVQRLRELCIKHKKEAA